MADLVTVINFDPPKNRLLMHSIYAHNYWVERGYACPYCTKGSKIVPRSVIEENCK